MSPPTTDAVPIPTTRGRDATEWLEAHGIVATDPSVRSSDRDIITDEFAYYLVRRLNLVPFFTTSEALSRGSWFHARLEYALTPEEEARSLVLRRLAKRIDEIAAACAAFGVNPENFIKTETTNCNCALGWFSAASAVRISSDRGTLLDVLANYELLGSEIMAVWKSGPGGKRNPSIACFDKLCYHPKQNALWILDGKTCRENPKVRLQTCSIEFQSWHYLHILRALLDEGLVHRAYPNLPPNVHIGGIAHLAVQKPTIDFGMSDRPYRYSAPTAAGTAYAEISSFHPMRWTVSVRDPATIAPTLTETYGVEGEAFARVAELADGVAPKKSYVGEPSLDFYIQRCAHWYAGTGPYEAQHTYREANPPVNVSYTTAPYVYAIDNTDEYTIICAQIVEMARRAPQPNSYPRRSSSLLRYGSLSEYTPFYVNPPAHWPEIIRRERFVISPRDSVADLEVGLFPLTPIP